jgi:hypothetical protein
MSGKNYNDMLIETRTTISKHFLKRKVKAAFEREPLEKNKTFFNIPFLPTANMFATLPQPTPQPIQNTSNYQHNRPIQNNPSQANLKSDHRNVNSKNKYF